MYISKIKIKGFRNFVENEIMFNDGINIIIGPNNAGKSNLLKAISLILDSNKGKKLDVYDFNQNITLTELKSSSPKVSINLFISQSENEDFNSDDLVTIANYLTCIEKPYEAMLTYEFFLPQNEEERYRMEIESATNIHSAWKIIKQEFLRYYTYKIWGGEPKLQVQADNESLKKFDFQFLDAIRNVERDMFSGRNTLLRDVLDFFIDYEIKRDTTKSEEEKLSEIKELKKDFSKDSDALLSKLQVRMKRGKKEILQYAKETGASFNEANPDFEGDISDTELFSALKLIIKDKTGLCIPAANNGLGYNNLIYISLLLSKMQANSDGNYLGSNAKVFPILAIEEPEAHLHPSMQYKFLKFLRDNKDVQKKARQIFITTHSTQITSAVSLDEIICISNDDNKISIGYPGKVFTSSGEDIKSKKYVQRFLDATKSNMLFAQKIILVEGIAEELLIPTIAKYAGCSIEDNHVAVINVGGRYFEHFLKLFDSIKEYTMNKKVACLTDRDPVRRINKEGANLKKCYPYEFRTEPKMYDYKEHSENYIFKYRHHKNIHFFSQNLEKGKTLEYDLMLHNSTLELLLTDSISNKDIIKKIMELPFVEGIKELRNSKENRRIYEALVKSSWNDENKKNSLVASIYLNSIGKGENALELCEILESNYMDDNKKTFIVPEYIKKALTWIIE